MAAFKQAGVNIRREYLIIGGFHPVPYTPFSIQARDADESWNAAKPISEFSGCDIDVTVTWRDTDKVSPDLRGKSRRLRIPEPGEDAPPEQHV